METIASQEAERQAPNGSRRDRLALLCAVMTVVGVAAAFLFARDTQFLMPGPLASPHASIENCSACHTASGNGQVTWLRGLVAGDRHADSKACLSCHEIPNTAFNPHSASEAVLKQSTDRLARIAAETPAPPSARAQNAVFPTDSVVARGLYCATCHQEHQGASFKLNKISNEQCVSCHAVKFDSFDGHHPRFEGYPFKRRTPIIYDHAAHFGKHFPEMATKDPAKPIPATCSTCHNSDKDRRVMAVTPFDQTCSTCHLDQIAGNERVSGPKGIAFLTLPGLDLQTLKKKGVVGEWPSASEAELTPFMKVIISRTERGRTLISAVDGVNLQDLTGATDAQIRAVTNLVWEIKRLFYALVKGKASDVLADLAVGNQTKLSASAVADLTASIPQDVIIGAQRQWLPNLGTEMANRPENVDEGNGGWTPTITESAVTGATKTTNTSSASQSSQAKQKIDGSPGAASVKEVTADAGHAVNKGDTGAKTAKEALSANDPPPSRGADQTDDLLHPTEEELRAMKTAATGLQTITESEGGGGSAGAARVQSVPTNASSPEQQVRSAPVVSSIKSDVDPENWAAYGGWYRQDYAISYRPTGHKDKFIYTWLSLAGPQAPKGDKTPVTAVFDVLTSKDAQGSCTKCHSVDDVPGKGRRVNFAPPSGESKRGRFTNFVHEPHFGVLDSRGCLTCHSLEKDRPYLETYAQGNPKIFASNFGSVTKETCQTCHTGSKARQDCLLCHKYHVNGVITPIVSTKIPAQ